MAVKCRINKLSLLMLEVYKWIKLAKMKALDNPINLIFYSLGFALGNYFGSFFEEKIAFGHVTLHVISKFNSASLVKELRNNGFGVTTYCGYGIDESERKLLQVLIKRKELPRLTSLIESIDKESFISVLDTKSIKGGYFTPGPLPAGLFAYKKPACGP
ncbi:MAG: DUF2179 domain-containing protein [Candidatus Syntrophonatronum acetioxidans]|uniref:DUF2179 domain-containing protein n=1 Tax=Candidatus Syntrophonatronum acetioxidans TaxID=1795816 RepID=A0A424YBB4_9FIRM|nr:MAG: DUF2179 domain-containing protein [Candidatus Syntrophonatronum acetioxidans]